MSRSPRHQGAVTPCALVGAARCARRALVAARRPPRRTPAPFPAPSSTQSGQVVPGATVTLTNEADGRRAHRRQRRARRVRVPRGPAGILHRPRRARRLPHVRAAQQRRQREQPARPRPRDAGGRRAERSRLRRRRTARSSRPRTATTRGLLTSKQIAQMQTTRPRRHVAAASCCRACAPRPTSRRWATASARNVPNISGMRRRWNQVTVDGLNGNELSGTAAFLVGDQPRRDRRSQSAAEHLQGGIRPQRRRQHRDRQQERQHRLPRAARYWYGRRDKWNANTLGEQPRRHAEGRSCTSIRSASTSADR